MNRPFAEDAAVAELKAVASLPFARATAMPKSVYTSESFAAREVARIFRRDWICLGRSSSLPNPGDYLAAEVGGEPVMVLRDETGALRAQSNVCRHRMSVLLEGRGTAARITCPYHGWTYNLDGRLRGAAYMEASEIFERKAVCLPQIRCEDWLGWIMVCLDPDTPPPSETLADLAAEIAPFGMEHYVEDFRQEFTWATNWKVLAENFMESYHLPVCHAGTIGGVSDIEASEFPPGEAHYNMHSILKDPSFFLACAHPTNTRLTGDMRLKTVLISVYPSLMITLTPGYFWYLSLQPEGPGKVQVRFGGGLSPEFIADPASADHFARLRALLDDVNAEDKGCTERVYRGISSGMGAPGPLSQMERPIYDFARWISERVQ